MAAIRTELGVEAGVGTVDTRVTGLRVSRLGAEQARVTSIAAVVTSRHLQIAQAFDDARFALDVDWRRDGRRRLETLSPAGVSIPRPVGDREGARTRRGIRSRARGPPGRRRSRRTTWGEPGPSPARRQARNARRSAPRHVDEPDVRPLRQRLHLQLGLGADRAQRRALPRRPLAHRVAPHLVLAPAGMDGHVSIDVPAADLVDLSRLREVIPLPAGIAIEGGRGRARLHANVELGSGSAKGDAEIVTQGMRARVGSTELFGDLDLALRASRSGGAGGATDLSGSTLAVTHAGTGSGAPPEDAWWANVALREATLRTIGGVHFDAKAHVAAKDASPATVLVAENSGVPTWAADIFRMPALDADAQVLVAPSSVEVRSFVASGAGSTSIRAEYARRDGHQDGAVLLDLGWIDLGLRSDRGLDGPGAPRAAGLVRAQDGDAARRSACRPAQDRRGGAAGSLRGDESDAAQGRGAGAGGPVRARRAIVRRRIHREPGPHGGRSPRTRHPERHDVRADGRRGGQGRAPTARRSTRGW